MFTARRKARITVRLFSVRVGSIHSLLDESFSHSSLYFVPRRIRPAVMMLSTRNPVFIRVHVSIQYQANSTHLFEAFYSLASPTRQLTTRVHDMIRSTMPRLYLDDIFSAQDSIASEFHGSLNDGMNRYGLLVHHALITGIYPNECVKRSMNEVQASKRTKEAMPHVAEAARILTVKDAEARAERAYLIGVGVARERREIARGIRDVVDGVDDGCRGAKSAMDLLLLTQYYDVLTELSGARLGCDFDRDADADDDECREGNGGFATSLFLTHMPDTVSRLTEAATECFTCDAVRVENLLDL